MLTAAQRQIARTFPSYREFVDAALFAPSWGYYSTGAIRFGEGGHYDTYPLALSPWFGRMVAARAFRQWERCGAPSRFDVCELGAGNGQLCLDTVVAIAARAQRSASWRRFDAAFRYRIIERSPALVARQRAQLGALAGRVTWTRADLSSSRATLPPRRDAGLVVANEVLDCLAHHKILRPRGGPAQVVFVVPSIGGTAVARGDLATVMTDPPRRSRLRWREVPLPLDAVPGLQAFCDAYVPELSQPGRAGAPYFACPEMPRLIANVGRLYRRAETLWIDYGDTRAFHLRAPETRKVFAGPPRSKHAVYDDPGRDDITFMVDFTVAMQAAHAAGLEVTDYGPQAHILQGTGLRLDAGAVDEILRYRAVGWMLTMMAPAPEREWRQGSLTWGGGKARGGRLRSGVARDVATFLGQRPSRFQVMILRQRTPSR